MLDPAEIFHSIPRSFGVFRLRRALVLSEKSFKQFVMIIFETTRLTVRQFAHAECLII